MSAGKGKKMLLILSIFLSFFVLVLHGIPSTGGIWFFRFGLWENLSLRIWENLFLLIPLPIGAGLALVAAVFCADPGVGPDGARSWRRKSLGNLVLDDGLCFLVPSLGKGSGGFLGRFLCFIFKTLGLGGPGRVYRLPRLPSSVGRPKVETNRAFPSGYWIGDIGHPWPDIGLTSWAGSLYIGCLRPNLGLICWTGGLYITGSH
ncbi:hypothetical protein V6N11_056268 [Hibiscus sabdariffa]|uniref:Uncharacterized protein n=1 Tax=Hibiscus sabdariffa TaxID=183260 RepID=A0ABR2T3A2_9ROSI